jgi:hypothetical protein
MLRLVPSPRHFGIIHLQLLIAAVAILCVIAAPPARGAILILSFGNEGAKDIAGWALGDDVRLLGLGPVPNSLVVMGPRAALRDAAFRHRGLLLSGAFTGCGSWK